MVGPEKQVGEQLTSPAAARESGAPSTGQGIIREVDLDLIDLTPINARQTMDNDFVDQLGASIEKRGLISRPIVRPHPTNPGRYETIAGSTRVVACGQRGFTRIEVEIRPLDDVEAFAVGWEENDKRRNLSDGDQLFNVRRLIHDVGWDIEHPDERTRRDYLERIKRLLNRPETWIRKRARLLKDPPVVAAIEAGLATIDTAYEIVVATTTPDEALSVIARLNSERMTRQQLRAFLADLRRAALAPDSGSAPAVAVVPAPDVPSAGSTATGPASGVQTAAPPREPSSPGGARSSAPALRPASADPARGSRGTADPASLPASRSIPTPTHTAPNPARSQPTHWSTAGTTDSPGHIMERYRSLLGQIADLQEEASATLACLPASMVARLTIPATGLAVIRLAVEMRLLPLSRLHQVLSEDCATLEREAILPDEVR